MKHIPENFGRDPLPPGWTWTTLGEIAAYLNGRAFKPSEWEESGTPIIRIQNLNDPTAPYNYSTREYEDRFKVRNGDLLFAWSASLGAYLWKRNNAWLNQHIFKVVPKPVIDKYFLFYTFERTVADIYSKTHGSGMVHVTKGKFEATDIPLPPLPEQHRIVGKIEALFSELDKGVEQLKTAAQQLKVYRQSVLKAAFEGKLTEKWRAEQKSSGRLPAEGGFEGKLTEEWRNNQRHPERSPVLSGTESKGVTRMAAEPASEYTVGAIHVEDPASGGESPLRDANELLSRIKQEREAQAKATGKKLKPITPLTEKELAELPNLPEGWVWVRIGELVENFDGKRVPLSAKYRETFKGEYPYYGACDVIDHVRDFLFDGEYLLIGEDGANLLSRSRPLAFVVRGKFWVNNHAHVCKPHGAMHIRFLEAQFNSLTLNGYVSGTAQPKLTQANLDKMPVAVCSQEEQHQIVSEIESRLSVCDKLEETIAASLQQAEALRQSILKKAFEGKLVPQDPNDEPASVLLERIKQEREKAAVKNVAGIKRNSPPRSPSLRKRGGRG